MTNQETKPAMAESVEPVGEVRWVADVPDTIKEVKFYGDTKPPVGTKLYAAPPAGGGGSPEITKEQFDGMGYSERLKVFNEQPELFKQFTEV